MEEEQKKSSNLIIILIFIVIIGVAGYICYSKFVSNKNEATKATPESKETNTAKEISTASSEVAAAMESLDRIDISDIILYKTGGFNISNLPKVNILLTAVWNVDSKYVDPCDRSYKAEVATVDVLNEVLAKYILDQKITLDDIKTLKNSEQGLEFIILKENGITVDGACGDEFEKNDYVERKVVKAETDGDYLYIYEKNAFARFIVSDYDDYKVNYFKEYSRTNMIEKNKNSLRVVGPDGTIPEEDYPNWNLYDTYKYTFKKVNNVYYFQSFELSK